VPGEDVRVYTNFALHHFESMNLKIRTRWVRVSERLALRRLIVGRLLTSVTAGLTTLTVRVTATLLKVLSASDHIIIILRFTHGFLEFAFHFVAERGATTAAAGSRVIVTAGLVTTVTARLVTTVAASGGIETGTGLTAAVVTARRLIKTARLTTTAGETAGLTTTAGETTGLITVVTTGGVAAAKIAATGRLVETTLLTTVTTLLTLLTETTLLTTAVATTGSRVVVVRHVLIESSFGGN